MSVPSVTSIRLRDLNGEPLRPDGDYVLYWMVAARRAARNFALDRAVELARELDKPLVVLEPLRVDYRWASERFHRFVLDGMSDNAAAFEGTGVHYYPYVEPQPGAGKGLLEACGRAACAVVTDDYPAFFLPHMLGRAAEVLEVRLEAVDSNGILPLRAAPKAFTRAFDFRRFLQRELPRFLDDAPRRFPLRSALRPCAGLPRSITQRWPRAELADGIDLAQMPIDQHVQPTGETGGSRAARRALKRFLDERLTRYGDDRNQPETDGASGLSPYLHFGHLSSHEILAGVARHESWTSDAVADTRSGQRNGWWGMSEAAEAFLDQVVTWRELGFNFCVHRRDTEEYASLPDWARTTLGEHAGDARPYVYSLEEFEAAATHDDLWNAAQNQLRAEGRIHNYLRMLWGKKILHWSASPEAALAIMIELNNKYALDGRDPNSYSGIFWVLGRYDRAWGPERPVFGKIRFMSGANTRRKLRVKEYIERWSASQSSFGF